MIKNITSKIKYLPGVLAGLIVPFAAAAYNEVQNGLQTSALQTMFGFSGGGLSSSNTLSELIFNVIRIALGFAGAVAVVFVIIGGFQYMTSSGNEEQAEKGKKTLINAIIGVVVIVMSYVIINVITNLVSSPSGNGY
jgi:hypothetical protein